MSRYYIDCEFDGHNGPLLSIAMVHESGFGLHVSTNADVLDVWVRDNVLTVIDQHDADMFGENLPINSVGNALRHMIGADPQPTIIADSPVDIGRFCQAISTGADGKWQSANYERMTFVVENVDCYPTTLEGAVQHNAWWDAMALRHKLSPTPPTETIAEREKEG